MDKRGDVGKLCKLLSCIVFLFEQLTHFTNIPTAAWLLCFAVTGPRFPLDTCVTVF